MSDYLVYKHTSPSGHSYIGYTYRGMMIRWKDEVSDSKYYIKMNPKFYSALRKYPNEVQWIHEILINNIPTLEEAKNLEILCIFYFDTFVNGYNSTIGGDGPGIISNETKRKMSESHKGQIPWNKGMKNPYSKETLKQMSEIKTGKKRKPLSEKVKNKISKSHIGIKPTFKSKKKNSEKHYLLYKIITPTGKILIIKGLKKYCHNMKLSYNCMLRLVSGKRKQHKGFKCQKIV